MAFGFNSNAADVANNDSPQGQRSLHPYSEAQAAAELQRQQQAAGRDSRGVPLTPEMRANIQRGMGGIAGNLGGVATQTQAAQPAQPAFTGVPGAGLGSYYSAHTPEESALLARGGNASAAQARTPGVGVAPQNPIGSATSAGNTAVDANGRATGAYNPSQGQLHQGYGGTPSGGVIVNPQTGQLMVAPTRDQSGNLILRPGEQGFTSSQQRVNLDPYAQRLGQVGDIQMQRGLAGATLAGMPQVEADRMRAAQIDRSGFDQQAMQQNALARQGNQAIGMLQGAAAGNAPSAALVQQQQGIEAAQRAQMAMAASSRGGADQRAAAMRQGQMAGSEMAMQGVGQAAALRAQEMAANRGQLVGAIGQQQQLAQGQGMNQANIAQAQAGLAQQAGLANQGSNLQASMANQQGYLGATGMDQGLVGMGAGLYQQGAGLGLTGTAFNNQQNQTDFEQQMKMQDAQTALYGISQGVAAQRYAADQASNAAIIGGAMNAGGQLLGASMQAFSPQQPRKY